jgi:hypothetical protein
MKRLNFAIAILALGLAGASEEVRGAIPSSSFLVRSAAQKHQGFRNVRIRTLLHDGGALAQPLKTVTWVDYTKSVYRVAISDPAGTLLASLERSFALPGGENAGDEDLAIATFERTDRSPSTGAWALLSPSALGLARELISQGVPVRPEKRVREEKGEVNRRGLERTGLRRLGKNAQPVAWVIGQVPLPSEPVTEESDRGPYSEFWLLKDAFLPVRVVLRRESGGEVELRFENFRSVREFSFPREVALRLDSKLKAREELQELDVNGDPPELKRPFTGAQGWTDAGRSADTATQEAVKLFLQYLR